MQADGSTTRGMASGEKGKELLQLTSLGVFHKSSPFNMYQCLPKVIKAWVFGSPSLGLCVLLSGRAATLFSSRKDLDGSSSVQKSAAGT